MSKSEVFVTLMGDSEALIHYDKKLFAYGT